MTLRHLLCPALVAGVVWSCGQAELGPVDAAAIQLAAATAMVASMAANPGPLVVVCVAYAPGMGSPALPTPEGGSLRVTGPDGCRERAERLTEADGEGQAISLRVDAPEPAGRERARVSVVTSTGPGDAAFYTCTVRRREGVWRSDACDLDAIT